MSQNRNILFIVIDQLRADCLTGALAEHVKLPNLRQFMKEGVTFKQHFSVTNPCGPSRASLLTGQYAMNHRSVRNGTPLRHDTPNLATELRKSGYLPMLFGYTDTSVDPRVYPAEDLALKCIEYVMPGFHEMLEVDVMYHLDPESGVVQVLEGPFVPFPFALVHLKFQRFLYKDFFTGLQKKCTFLAKITVPLAWPLGNS